MADDMNRLKALRDKMTDRQRKDMAEIIANELKARQQATQKKSSKVQSSRFGGSLSQDDVGQIYKDLDSRLDSQAGRVRERVSLSKHLPRPSSSMTQIFLGLGIVTLALAKILLSSGVVDAATKKPEATAPIVVAAAPQIPQQPTTPSAPTEAPAATTAGEKQLLSELDARRVELEKRTEALKDRERDLDAREKELASRIAELRTLTRKLSEVRQEKDQRYEARLEQLANVYGSMAPNEAAPLIAQLDNQTALSLLERLPGKRMGQVLSSMDKNRAVDLTKQLTDRKKIESVQ